MIKNLWQHLTKRRRKQFFLLLILMIVASIMEIISIGAVVPFLGALTSPEQIYKHQLAQPLIQILEITESSQLLLPLTVIFVMATLIAATVRLLLLYVSTRLSYAVGADLSIDIYRRTLYQDYSIHTSRNSSEIINSIITKTNTVIGGILAPLLNLISSVIIMIGVISIVFTINAQVALITFSIFTLFYWIISFFTKKSLQKNSQLIADKSTQMIKSLQEGLGGIRDVLIDGTQEFYCKLYQNSDLLLRRASGDNIFIASSPRYLMEAIGMILIAILAYSLTLQEGGVMVAIPVLGALAIGAQKLLPALQQAYSSYSTIKGVKSSFIDVLNLLDQPLPYNASQNLIKLMPFKQEIIFKDLSFRYTKDTPWILKNVNLSFKKGEKIGFIGVTGSGKSTLLDILMGLLTPTSGEILIDGVTITQENRRAWQAHISHVPQSIYLADSTIQENIAFGLRSEQIKEHKTVQAAQQAQISETINSLKNKYKSFVGEQGIQLSGGQRQRIGIARALYKDSDVLIFDEATSALDNQTEQKIMEQIAQLNNNKTIFIIAHRLTTLKQCDTIIRINTDYRVEKLNFNQIRVNEE
jgi:ABC-type multidrug transport system fused ATPase/permease subunit